MRIAYGAYTAAAMLCGVRGVRCEMTSCWLCHHSSLSSGHTIQTLPTWDTVMMAHVQLFFIPFISILYFYDCLLSLSFEFSGCYCLVFNLLNPSRYCKKWIILDSTEKDKIRNIEKKYILWFLFNVRHRKTDKTQMLNNMLTKIPLSKKRGWCLCSLTISDASSGGQLGSVVSQSQAQRAGRREAACVLLRRE